MVDFSTNANDIYVQTPNTFSALPAATMFPGAKAYITDSLGAVIGATVNVGGGTNKVMLMSDGTNWIITDCLNSAGNFQQVVATSAFATTATISSTIVALQTAFPSGGQAGFGIKLSTATNFGVFIGTGIPTLAAATNSLYMRSDGSTATTRLYVALTAGGSWTAVVCSA